MSRNRVLFSLCPTSCYVLLFMCGTLEYLVAATSDFPSVPKNLQAVAHTSYQPQVVLTWNQATDNIGVTRYNIYKNGTFFFSPKGVGVTYTDTSVSLGQSYTYAIQAGDGDGNNSLQSDTVAINVTDGAISHITSSPQGEDQVSVPIDIPQATVYSSVSYNDQSGVISSPDTVGLSSFGKELHITWKNPKSSQLKSIRVIKKIGSYPTGVTDGTIICDGLKEVCVDREVAPKTTYYYGVYAVDQSFVTSRMVLVFGSLVEEVKIATSAPQSESFSKGVSSSTPFLRILKIGSIGDDVRSLQIFLNTHGFVITASGPGSKGYETSLFGPATEKALKAYQCSKKIVCDGTPASTGYGVVGKTTRGYLNKKE